MYATVAKDEQPTVAVSDFSSMRDYLLLRVMMASGQCCGAASNLTIKEYEDGIWTESDGKIIYPTQDIVRRSCQTAVGRATKRFWGHIHEETHRYVF